MFRERSKHRRLATLTGVALALSLPTVARAADGDAPRVVATFSVIADMARRVGGERISLDVLVGPDGDSHAYEPEPADAVALAGADLVLVNGLQFEGFIDRLIEASETSAAIVAVSEGAALLPAGEGEHHDAGEGDESEDDEHEDEEHADDAHGHGEFDPHAWHSVPNARAYVADIRDALCDVDPDGCEAYTANTDAYDMELEALDAEIRDGFAGIVPARRTVITSHDAFGYFGHEYGMRFHAPQGLSTAAEASAADVATLIRQISDEGASALFVENIGNPALIERIGEETGLQVAGTLYSDALSGPDTPAATYVAMMRHNAATLASAMNASGSAATR